MLKYGNKVIFIDAGNNKNLDYETELELIKKAKLNDKKACSELVKNKIKFIVQIAKRFINRGIEYEDLVSLGCVGFLKAIDGYEESDDKIRLSTYSSWWIIREIQRGFEKAGTITFSNNAMHLQAKIYSAEQRLMKETPNYSISDIVRESGVSEKDVLLLYPLMLADTSLDNQLNNDKGDNYTLHDIIPSEGDSQDVDIKKQKFLNKILKPLKEHERELVQYHYIEGVSMADLGRNWYNLSRAAIQVRMKRIHDKLKERFNGKKIIEEYKKYVEP